ncbi:MAG: PrsW family glutamic-type intramembrane protease [Candidatus Paceibacterota bacterium]|jgi:RsiW-degrading membrane proteinase PrsW (M82 family)
MAILGITDPSITALVYSVLTGILPALFWLWFWTREDKMHPEPRGHLLLVFLGGMAAVAIAYPLQKLAFDALGLTASTLFIWATIEELLKYIVVAALVLYTVDYDEPVDAIIYLITAALGFSAMENTLFILSPMLDGDIFRALITGNTRFIGASMLHVVCSAILGYSIAREFFRGKVFKMAWRILGLSVAIGLHTAFNLFIIDDKNGSRTFLAFSVIWMLAIVVLILFENIKKAQVKETP